MINNTQTYQYRIRAATNENVEKISIWPVNNQLIIFSINQLISQSIQVTRSHNTCKKKKKAGIRIFDMFA